jgi:hypothetical protein
VRNQAHDDLIAALGGPDAAREYFASNRGAIPTEPNRNYSLNG